MGKMFVVDAAAMLWKWMKRIKERLPREDMFIIHRGNRITRDFMLEELTTVTWDDSWNDVDSDIVDKTALNRKNNAYTMEHVYG